jgi:FKBP-type peptidyl-prolyl cis-trans isomerase FkpA
MKILLSLFLVALLANACKKVSSSEQAKIDNDIILKYIADHNLAAIATGSGLYYVINEKGTGSSCNSNSTVKVAYKGYFTNGKVFDESNASGVSFGLKQVIAGWTEGIPYLNEGGKGILLIPSALGYGTEGNSSIPENSVLVFEVELIDVI